MVRTTSLPIIRNEYYGITPSWHGLHVGCKTALNGGTIYIPNAIYKNITVAAHDKAATVTNKI